MLEERWPALPYDAWKDTYATLHMWTQIVGKIALALAPRLNHSWGVSLLVTSRGLSTRPLAHGGRTVTVEFDFVRHQLRILASDGAERALPLKPRSVAEFHREVMATLDEMGLSVRIWTLPAEVPSPVRFEEDTVHAAYDPVFANRLWRILLELERVLNHARCSFIGKCSPVHFFWGGFDLAVTRFSGRPAPTRDGPAFMREAYSHEVISHGFWPGSGALLEPALYAYAVPEPPGFKEGRVRPVGAFYHRELGEFILPYQAVRAAASPDDDIRAFVESTYTLGADLGKWDRSSLEAAAP